MRLASADDVRAMMADSVLGAASDSLLLGDIALHPHQHEGVERIKLLLARHRGALLADEVGLGKTYVALGVARDARAPIVIAPAALRDTWLAASRKACVPVRFLSVEGLSRDVTSSVEPDLVIVDEAHHLRSPSTRRFAAAGALCRVAKVLLVSATPVQNSVRDLRTILSLFLGASAHAMSVDDLARYVVRRGAGDVATALAALPLVEGARWLEGIRDVDCLERLLTLPRAVPPADGDDGGVLLTYTLVRQWSSSRAALRSALRRRLARSRALEDALLAGRLPTRAELAAWCFSDGVQQLAFPELAATSSVTNGAELLVQVQRHSAAVRELLTWLDSSPDPDLARTASLAEVMRRHRGERIVAFSEYADTVMALYRTLAPVGRVAMLTHAGGRVPGGPLRRRDVLARFAAGAASRTPERERIDLLLTTDVLSEGVDLHDASVVVHLDLAWNPARLEQRVGRLRRLGASHESIAVYLMPPPAPAERLLKLEQRLRLKLDDAARTMGLAGAILPGIASGSVEATAPREERITTILRGWRRSVPSQACPSVASTVSSEAGAVACVQCDGVASLVAVIRGRVLESRSIVERVLAGAGGAEIDTNPAEVASIRETVESWLRHRVVSDVVSLTSLRVAHHRRALLHRVDVISRRVPRHVQPQLAPLMRAARAAATATLSAGAERVLDVLAQSQMSDTAWLQAVGEFAALHARPETGARPQLLALLILRPA